jgi:hypothetical protein
VLEAAFLRCRRRAGARGRLRQNRTNDDVPTVNSVAVACGAARRPPNRPDASLKSRCRRGDDTRHVLEAAFLRCRRRAGARGRLRQNRTNDDVPTVNSVAVACGAARQPLSCGRRLRDAWRGASAVPVRARDMREWCRMRSPWRSDEFNSNV